MPAGRSRFSGLFVVLLLCFQLVQHAVHRQLRQDNHLLNAECQIARRTIQEGRQLSCHHIRRGEGFVGMDKEGFRIDAWADGEDWAGAVDGFCGLFGIGFWGVGACLLYTSDAADE